MTCYILITASLVAGAILFILWYNNGLGRPNSIKKKTLYILSIISFIGAIIFLNKTLYYTVNHDFNEVVDTLVVEINQLDRLIWEGEEYSEKVIKDMQLNTRDLLRRIELLNDSISDSIAIEKWSLEYYSQEGIAVAKKDSIDHLHIPAISDTRSR